jgi:hypothetical protein
MESLVLYMEAEACKVSMASYVITCFNGRVGFIPYLDYIVSVHCTPDAIGANLDYDQIDSKSWCIEIEYAFDFMNLTVSNFAKRMQALEVPKTPLVSVSFGRSLRNLNLTDMMSLLSACSGKIHI